jgi:NAD(P)H-dependent FMN reductase
MKICILSGSQRKNSNSLKTSQYIAQELNQLSIETLIYDMNDIALDIWSEDFWAQGSNEQKQWSNISQSLKESDAFVIVTPEYAGMVPPRLKNFLMKCNGVECGNKPAMLVAVSTGAGGAYPLAELRMSAFKNNFMCAIPQAIIVRHVAQCFNAVIAEKGDDHSVREIITYSLGHLIAYSKALIRVREQSLSDYTRYPYGI